MKKKLITLLTIIFCTSTQKATGAWLSQWWSGNNQEKTKPNENILIKEEEEYIILNNENDNEKNKDAEFSFPENPSEKSWENAQKKFIEETSTMLKKQELIVKKLESELKQKTKNFLPMERKKLHEYEKAKSFKKFLQQDVMAAQLYQKLFDEADGLRKILEIRNFVSSSQYSTFVTRVNEIKRRILNLIDQAFENGQEQKIYFNNTFIAMKSEWLLYVKNIKKLCKKYKIPFTQSSIGLKYLSQKVQELKDLQETINEKISSIGNLIKPEHEPIAFSTYKEQMETFIESTEKVWGFFKTYQELKKSIDSSIAKTKFDFLNKKFYLERAEIQSIEPEYGDASNSVIFFEKNMPENQQ